MKSLLKLFGGRATRKNTQSISAIRMQSLGVLKVYLEHVFNAPATLTQVDVAVTAVEKDASGVYCLAMIEAFFFCDNMEERYGREGMAPIPPKVTIKIRFRADNENVLCWETKEVKGTITNVEVARIDTRMFWMELYDKIEEFDRRFRAYRPFGRPILAANHDQVVWTINSTEH